MCIISYEFGKFVITLYFIVLYGLGHYLWLRDVVYNIAYDYEAYDSISILRLCLLVVPFFIVSNLWRCLSCIINYGIKVQCVFIASILYNEKEGGKWLHHRRLLVLVLRILWQKQPSGTDADYLLLQLEISWLSSSYHLISPNDYLATWNNNTRLYIGFGHRWLQYFAKGLSVFFNLFRRGSLCKIIYWIIINFIITNKWWRPPVSLVWLGIDIFSFLIV